ncbi:MAG: hypothetical protein AAF902_16725 [Chloroflexota bacterium]
MYYLNDLDNRSRQIVEDELNQSGETLWWVGKPQPWGTLWANFSLSQIIFGVCFFGIAIFIFRQFMAVFEGFSSMNSFGLGRVGQYFPYLFLLIFGLIIFNGLKTILTPIWKAIASFYTIYAVTDKRAMIIRWLPRKSVRSYYPQDFDDIERIGDDMLGNVTFTKKTISVDSGHTYSKGSFTIRFGGQGSYGQSTQEVLMGFTAVSRPREVEDVLKSLVESTRS